MRRAAGVLGMADLHRWAVNPTVMGATKRLAEAYAKPAPLMPPATARFTIVRFGNVLGSTGSVIHCFNGNWPAADLDRHRPGDDALLHDRRRGGGTGLQAAALNDYIDNGGAICVLDMGRPVKSSTSPNR